MRRGLTILEVLIATVLLAMLAAAVMPLVQRSPDALRETLWTPQLVDAARDRAKEMDAESLAETIQSGTMELVVGDELIQLFAHSTDPEKGDGTLLLLVQREGDELLAVWTPAEVES